MFHRRIKRWYFALAGVNTLACSLYGNYLFFHFRDHFGFGNLGNLAVSALHGLVFSVAAWQGGRFAQRRGYFAALRVGFTGMTLALLAGAFLDVLAGQIAVLVAWTVCMCFTWPALEALVSEGETPAELRRVLGRYNLTWAGSAGVTYFVGGAVLDRLGPLSLFLLPAALYVAQLGALAWLSRQPEAASHPPPARMPEGQAPEAAALQQPVSPRTFLRMAWLANPFAYIGINTVLAIVPGLAKELKLTTTQSGLFCSLWFFARVATFVGLWQWTGWHYRFRWLLAAFAGLIVSFLTILLVRDYWWLVLAQVVFGACVGLLYYSSLFYSMDVGETKGEHGGLHEAMIGVGICVGPAIGATGILLAPQNPHAGAYAVTALLVCGLGGLLALRWLPGTGGKS